MDPTRTHTMTTQTHTITDGNTLFTTKFQGYTQYLDHKTLSPNLISPSTKNWILSHGRDKAHLDFKLTSRRTHIPQGPRTLLIYSTYTITDAYKKSLLLTMHEKAHILNWDILRFNTQASLNF